MADPLFFYCKHENFQMIYRVHMLLFTLRKHLTNTRTFRNELQSNYPALTITELPTFMSITRHT